MAATIGSLTYQGRNLLSHRGDPREAYAVYDQWIEDVTDWLSETAPGTGLGAEWQSLPDSQLGAKPYVLLFDASSEADCYSFLKFRQSSPRRESH
jgi:hypothetical protein